MSDRKGTIAVARWSAHAVTGLLRSVRQQRRRTFMVILFLTGCFVLFSRFLKTTGHHGYRMMPFNLLESFGLGTGTSNQVSLARSKPCPADFDHLQREEYNLTSTIIYQKICVRPTVDSTVDRDIIQHIKEPIIGKGYKLRLDGGYRRWMRSTCTELDLSVPAAYPEDNYSHLLFGVATTYDRLIQSLPYFESWIAHSGTRLLAIVTDGEQHFANFTKVTRRFRHHGVDLTMVKPANAAIGVNQQHFMIVRDLLEHSTRKTQWLAIIDDDTYFPSLHLLSQALGKHNHSLPAYIGALSENFGQIKFHGYFAYGGAGVFLSVPLARELEPVIEQCLEEDSVPQGDGLLKYCIYSKTQTKFTNLPGLHQLDMFDDITGFYESGVLPLSLHHWKSWHHTPVDKMTLISDFCGSCVLQRFKLGADTVLSNGYSISVYANGTDGLDFTRIEGTWREAEAFRWSMGPIRHAVDKALKKTFYLINAERVDKKNLRQLYVYRNVWNKTIDESRRKSENLDEVVELWWEF